MLADRVTILPLPPEDDNAQRQTIKETIDCNSFVSFYFFEHNEDYCSFNDGRRNYLELTITLSYKRLFGHDVQFVFIDLLFLSAIKNKVFPS